MTSDCFHTPDIRLVYALDVVEIPACIMDKIHDIVHNRKEFTYLMRETKKVILYKHDDDSFVLNICDDKIVVTIDFYSSELLIKLIEFADEIGLIVSSYPFGVITKSNKFLKR